MMITSIPEEQIFTLLVRQLDNNFSLSQSEKKFFLIIFLKYLIRLHIVLSIHAISIILALWMG